MGRMLIEEFKEQHKVILERFMKAYEMGLETSAGKEALTLGKKSLLAHLKKEDEEFYPLMRKAAQKDRRLQAILDVFGTDMDQVTAAALSFFDKYEKGQLAGMTLAREFGTVSARLKQRISSEENLLYTEYEKALKLAA